MMIPAIEFAQASVKRAYTITTDELKYLNSLAVQDNLNRSISDEGIELLNPDGKHIISCVMPIHKNWEGKISIRAQVLMNIVSQDKPEMVFLDIKHRIWKTLMVKHPYIKIME